MGLRKFWQLKQVCNNRLTYTVIVVNKNYTLLRQQYLIQHSFAVTECPEHQLNTLKNHNTQHSAATVAATNRN